MLYRKGTQGHPQEVFMVSSWRELGEVGITKDMSADWVGWREVAVHLD